MRKIYTTLRAILCFLLPLSVMAQPVVDGDLSDLDYISIGTKENANAGFGANIDVSEILYYSDQVNSKLYLGVKGKLNTGASDGIGIFINFSDVSGLAAGTELGFSGAGHYMDGQGGGTNDNFKADFEVDYMLAMNPGAGSSSVFLDAAELVGSTGTDFLGTANQSGGTATDTDVFGTGAASTFAFNNGGAANQGFEVVFDYAALGISAASDIEVFAFVVSATGFFSDVTVPGDVSGGNLNFNPDFNAIGGGPYHTTFAPLPVELSYFEATVDQYAHTVLLEWLTASEENNDYFALERSADGRNFETIAEIATRAGDNFGRQEYFYSDEQPKPGDSYYRLRQVDLDGDEHFSRIINVYFSFTEIWVFPNPVESVLSVRLANPLNGHILIYNLQGQLVKFRSIEEEQGFDMEAGDLAGGFYIYRITDALGKDLYVDRFLKR